MIGGPLRAMENTQQGRYSRGFRQSKADLLVSTVMNAKLLRFKMLIRRERSRAAARGFGELRWPVNEL